jgi:hypothetical protein
MSVSELTKEFPADEKFVFDRSDSTILAFDLCESGGSMEEDEVSCSVQSLVLTQGSAKPPPWAKFSYPFRVTNADTRTENGARHRSRISG